MKNPLFHVSTLYLKSPERIMALMMIMTLCLLVYSALEYRIRQVLKKADQTFPNPVGKETKTPTLGISVFCRHSSIGYSRTYFIAIKSK